MVKQKANASNWCKKKKSKSLRMSRGDTNFSIIVFLWASTTRREKVAGKENAIFKEASLLRKKKRRGVGQ